MKNKGSSILGAAKRLIDVRSGVPSAETHRRILHGQTLRQPVDGSQYQPQDGVTAASNRVTDIAARNAGRLGEPEDARLTGGTRSLMRRLSGLNIPRALSLPARSVTPQVSMGNANVA